VKTIIKTLLTESLPKFYKILFNLKYSHTLALPVSFPSTTFYTKFLVLQKIFTDAILSY